jgi:hypothetical protein
VRISKRHEENLASVDWNLNHNHDTGKKANQPACVDGRSPNHGGTGACDDNAVAQCSMASETFFLQFYGAVTAFFCGDVPSTLS